jgi:predicted regulator of Ras-like GTPase activity (Roadblock/LC7/MglB family)
MGAGQKIHRSQMEAAGRVLSGLMEAVPTDYIGLVAATGQPIAVISSTRQQENDTMAALAASAFGAARQLAGPGGRSFRSLLYETEGVNVSITSIADRVLLVVYFPRASDIGRVRLLVSRAASLLAPIMGEEKEEDIGSD